MGVSEPNKGSFKPGQSGNPSGRAREISEASHAVRYSSKEHIHQLYWKLLNSTKDQVREILANPEVSVIEAVILTAVLKDMELGETRTIDRMMDRVIGKPREQIDITGKVTIEDLMAQAYKKIE